jgi:hypothetical protein
MNDLEIRLLILVIVFGLTIYLLYRLGKSVKGKEDELMDMMSRGSAKKNLDKYKRKSTPKVPRINGSYYKEKRK